MLKSLRRGRNRVKFLLTCPKFSPTQTGTSKTGPFPLRLGQEELTAGEKGTWYNVTREGQWLNLDQGSKKGRKEGSESRIWLFPGHHPEQLVFWRNSRP